MRFVKARVSALGIALLVLFQRGAAEAAAGFAGVGVEPQDLGVEHHRSVEIPPLDLRVGAFEVFGDVDQGVRACFRV